MKNNETNVVNETCTTEAIEVKKANVSESSSSMVVRLIVAIIVIVCLMLNLNSIRAAIYEAGSEIKHSIEEVLNPAKEEIKEIALLSAEEVADDLIKTRGWELTEDGKWLTYKRTGFLKRTETVYIDRESFYASPLSDQYKRIKLDRLTGNEWMTVEPIFGDF